MNAYDRKIYRENFEITSIIIYNPRKITVMNQSKSKSEKKDYIIPQFEEIDFFDHKVKHWINFFGEEDLFTFKERIEHILEINKSVFEEGNQYIENIHQLLSNSENEIDENKINILPISPKEFYEEILTPHMLRTDPSDHHIIFNNTHLGGHPKHKDNLKIIERGKHTSLHDLLDWKNLYPHQQLSKFLRFEKNTISQSFLTSLQTIERSTEKLFQKDPFSIYKEEIFQEKFRRLNFETSRNKGRWNQNPHH
jgi:hypothetical protein